MRQRSSGAGLEVWLDESLNRSEVRSVDLLLHVLPGGVLFLLVDRGRSLVLGYVYSPQWSSDGSSWSGCLTRAFSSEPFLRGESSGGFHSVTLSYPASAYTVVPVDLERDSGSSRAIFERVHGRIPYLDALVEAGFGAGGRLLFTVPGELLHEVRETYGSGVRCRHPLGGIAVQRGAHAPGASASKGLSLCFYLHGTTLFLVATQGGRTVLTLPLTDAILYDALYHAVAVCESFGVPCSDVPVYLVGGSFRRDGVSEFDTSEDLRSKGGEISVSSMEVRPTLGGLRQVLEQYFPVPSRLPSLPMGLVYGIQSQHRFFWPLMALMVTEEA